MSVLESRRPDNCISIIVARAVFERSCRQTPWKLAISAIMSPHKCGCCRRCQLLNWNRLRGKVTSFRIKFFILCRSGAVRQSFLCEVSVALAREAR